MAIGSSYDARREEALARMSDLIDSRSQYLYKQDEDQKTMLARMQAEAELARMQAQRQYEEANDRSFGGYLSSALQGGMMGYLASGGNPFGALAGAGVGAVGYGVSPVGSPMPGQMAMALGKYGQFPSMQPNPYEQSIAENMRATSLRAPPPKIGSGFGSGGFGS